MFGMGYLSSLEYIGRCLEYDILPSGIVYISMKVERCGKLDTFLAFNTLKDVWYRIPSGMELFDRCLVKNIFLVWKILTDVWYGTPFWLGMNWHMFGIGYLSSLE